MVHEAFCSTGAYRHILSLPSAVLSVGCAILLALAIPPDARAFASVFPFSFSRFGIISRSRSGRVCEAATYRCCAPDGVDAARTDANACPEAARRFTGQGISLAERLDGDARGRTNSGGRPPAGARPASGRKASSGVQQRERPALHRRD